MALTKLTTDLENIQALSDTPNSTEGLTADELKALFDKAGEDIKTYINDTLTAELDTALTHNYIAATYVADNNFALTGTSETTYPLNTVLNVSGTKLTLNTTNNSIVVGAGVSLVKISYRVAYLSAAEGNKSIYIYKNTVASNQTIFFLPSVYNSKYFQMSFVDFYLAVAENDEITLRIVGANTDAMQRSTATRLYVTVVN